MCKVSVIIPVYNTELYLEECLKSALNQTLFDIEILCIDDGSTDASSSIIRMFMERDDRVRGLFLECNQGQAYARNRGIEQAQGEYLYFLDSDDMIKQCAMEKLYCEAVNDDLDVVMFDGASIYENDSLMQKVNASDYVRKNKYNNTLLGRELCEKMLANNEFIVSPCLQFWRRAYLNETGMKFMEGIIHEDFLFAFTALWNCARARHIPDKLFIRRYREGSTMTKLNMKKSFVGYFTGLYYIRKMLGGHVSDVLERYIESKYTSLLLNKNYISARNEIWNKIVEGTEKKAIFVNDEVRDAYLNFEACTKLHIPNGEFSKAFKNTVYKYSQIYIYGAGEIARGVLEGLAKDDICVEGFLVSSQEGNPKSFMGHPIRVLTETHIDIRNSIVVIALDKKYYADIASKIEDVLPGVDYILYNQ